MRIIDREKLYDQIVEHKLINLKSYSLLADCTFSSLSDAAVHFCDVGFRLDLDPNPLFSTIFYRNKYKEYLPSGISPFEHYLFSGEGLYYDPHPIINGSWVAAQLKCLASKDSVLGALLHKCAHYNLDPNPIFSVRFYLDLNPKVRSQRVHPIIHYLETGGKQHLRTHPLFWPDWMRAEASIDSPITLQDYINDHQLSRIPPNPFFDPSSFEVGASNNFQAPLFQYLSSWRSLDVSPNSTLDLHWFRRTFAQQLSITNEDPLTFVMSRGIDTIPTSENGQRLRSISHRVAMPASAAKRDRPRVGFFSHNLRFQGAQNSLFELASDLKRKRAIDPILFAPDEGPMKAAYEAAGIPVVKFRLPVNGLDDEKHYGRLFDKFVDQLRGHNLDLIHANTIQTYPAMVAAKILGCRSIWNIRESEDLDVHSKFMKPIAKNLYEEALSCATRYVFVSSTTAEKFVSSLGNINFDVIHNGINYNRLVSMSPLANRSYARAAWGFDKSDVVFFNVGTWTERKGQADILDALQIVDRRIWGGIRVLLIGANESPYSQDLKARYHDLPKSLRERVVIEEETKTSLERNRVIDAFGASDVFLFTSRIESYPRVINEAMYFGLPIISTPCFGVIEQMEDKKEGVFYDAGSASQLARHMEMMFIDERARRNFAISSKHSAHFVVDQYDDMVRGYLRSYELAFAQG